MEGTGRVWVSGEASRRLENYRCWPCGEEKKSTWTKKASSTRNFKVLKNLS
jgi:hypothetical protein